MKADDPRIQALKDRLAGKEPAEPKAKMVIVDEHEGPCNNPHQPIDLGPPPVNPVGFSFTQRAEEVGKKVAETVEQVMVGRQTECTYGGGSIINEAGQYIPQRDDGRVPLER